MLNTVESIVRNTTGFCANIAYFFFDCATINTYAGVITKKFIIYPKQTSVNITMNPNQELVYNGGEVIPQLTVTTEDGHLMVNKQDYSVYQESNDVNAGAASVIVQAVYGRCNYQFYQEFSYTISPLDISNCTISQPADQSYTGNALTPEVSVLYKNNKADYDISYKDNINPGKAIVTITGKGNFTGSITRTFNITGTIPVAPAPVPSPQPTPAVTIIAPKQVALKSVKAGKKKVTVKYKTVSGSTYQIGVKQSGKAWMYYNSRGTSMTIKGLKSKKKYSVRVRALRSGVYGSWSKTKTVKVK